MLIIGRAVAGLGASGLVNGAITIISSAVPRERRPRKLPLDPLVWTYSVMDLANLLLKQR